MQQMHIQIGLNKLKTNLNDNQQEQADKIAFNKETVIGLFQALLMAQSDNQHHRFYAQIFSLSKNLQIAIEKGLIRNDWKFRLNIIGPNILYNQITPVQLMSQEINEACLIDLNLKFYIKKI
ncbi:unnamed protein product [Paramecium pentaurelia]|uniref:Uncharacterized protein n=1 Tax=Paramecium pentaurelia TaxID=43138 RepID=A0A8S1WUW5_9CILI|nr:unnamed protein product [Paramecium pentaurelia]